MATTAPTRIDDDVFSAAKAAAAAHSRSAAQQVNHWARIGRQLEASASIRHSDIVRVLAGEALYDELPAPEQAMVRAAWDEGMTARLATLDFTARLNASGVEWAEADADGNVITHTPAAPVAVTPAPLPARKAAPARAAAPKRPVRVES